ncbi:MAG: response regulator, partial [Lachnospiraceae bacterium]|nr:response regulator [Lachnospiraceae bacterium]
MNKFQEDKMEYRQYRRTIEELERARQEAEKARLTEKEANAVKAEFLANMSHEVRTPINAMLGFNEMIMKETQESQTAEYAVNVKAAGTALISIINDIFDFTNMEASRLELSHSTYSTRELLQDMVTYADYNVGKKNLKLFTYIDENLPRELSGDAMRITQVLNNLISNAVKYTKKGFVAVTIKWEQITPDRGEMFVSVEDSGIGIRPEDMDKITEYFIRTDMKRNQHIQGLGLGLSIVTKILNLMNSTLQIKSEYEKGSEFSFRLMQDVVDPAPVGKVEWRHDFQFLLQESRGRKFVAPDAKILSVDDNAVNLDLFCGILKDTKVKIDTAMNGEEALELIRKNKYHIIFLDHMMPVMDGMKTLEIIKEERLCPETAVIALTANAVGGMEKRYLGAGFHAYMTKPIEGKRLKDMVRRFLPQVLVVDAKDDEPVSKMVEQKALEWNKIAEKFPYLDVNIAKGFCSDDINFYLEVLESYVIHQQVEVLEKSYANKDLDAYLVQIHALKSTSKSIGAMHMSEHARALEIAAKEKDMDYIRKNHVCVMAEYKELLERVSATLDQQDERQGEKVTISLELRDVPLILVVDDNGLNLRVAEKMLE